MCLPRPSRLHGPSSLDHQGMAELDMPPACEAAMADGTAGPSTVGRSRPVRLLGKHLLFGSFVGKVICVRHQRVGVQWELPYDGRCRKCQKCNACSPSVSLEDDLTIEEVESRLSPESLLQEAEVPGGIRVGPWCAAH